MPIDVRWDNDDKTIIRHTYQGEWTTTEYVEASHSTHDLIAGVKHSVHLLIIVTEGVQPLSDMIAAARDTRVKKHDRQGLQVVVGASQFMILITRIVRAVRPAANTVQFVKTINQAYAVISNASATNGKSR